MLCSSGFEVYSRCVPLQIASFQLQRIIVFLNYVFRVCVYCTA